MQNRARPAANSRLLTARGKARGTDLLPALAGASAQALHHTRERLGPARKRFQVARIDRAQVTTRASCEVAARDSHECA
jgi:hypothetical protein